MEKVSPGKFLSIKHFDHHSYDLKNYVEEDFELVSILDTVSDNIYRHCAQKNAVSSLIYGFQLIIILFYFPRYIKSCQHYPNM